MNSPYATTTTIDAALLAEYNRGVHLARRAYSSHSVVEHHAPVACPDCGSEFASVRGVANHASKTGCKR